MASSPPSSPPHPSKKPKMSSSATTSDADEDPSSAHFAAGEPRRRYKRRKVAIFLGYCGAGYQGMQKNPGARTIEGDLEEALFLAGAVPEADRGLPRRYDWARSARTDKGVSAAAQVVSGRFYVDPPGVVARLNAHLSDQIRVFGFKRVTNSFSAKKFCDRRRYVYLIPVFALDPSAHPDREAVMASMGSDNELARCLECSERGRKIPGLMGRWAGSSIAEKRVDPAADEAVGVACFSLEESDRSEANKLEKFDLGSGGVDDEQHDSSIMIAETNSANMGGNEVETGELVSAATDAAAPANMNPDATVEPVASYAEEYGKLSDEAITMKENSTMGPNAALENQRLEPIVADRTNGEQVTVKSRFYYGDEQRERFNRILKHYVGTHNFHNFTTRTKAEDPSARRYIISFDANRVVCIEGIEFVKCEVVGQSFMLHQIRKMIGLAVAVMRNCAPESLMDVALKKDVNINVPTAPEVGLYLDECLFTSYNQKWKDSHEALTMEAYAEEAEEFKMKYIYPHIASMEHKEGAVALWLHSLNQRNYPDFCFTEASRECATAAGKDQVDNSGEQLL
ncbi:tRNA pseudouridine synthase [Musa troglodytarum]|uniref:tRNA pseudouridine synthase n=1 Tax=Musa troglodytarum TaxID=320322 RepID=A0A9E7EKS4_9LILI|nr:tRNA pseudouridine synthase [Musa troglodytarum]